MIPTLYETGLGREPRDKTSVFKEERGGTQEKTGMRKAIS